MKLAPPCRCNACSHGCRMGSGMLAEGDAKKLAAFLNMTEKELREKHLEEIELFNRKMLRPKIRRKENKPYGQCTFYDEKKGCTVHKAKPLQCKVSMGCKEYSSDLTAWFTLNHVLNTHDPEALRQYAQYVKAGGCIIPEGKMEDLITDKKMREKILAYGVLK
ncbi:YkgJ family cysteine cluster protein [Candidatus Woesearchaeota archaeon]|nr:YkgJ family cysteine cluster protein [Candidatus Woesearchaeota archaeon]